VSFVLPAGEVAVVVGGTGEGKTTLVRTLLGLERPRSGEVRFGPTSLTSARPGLVDRPFAWVPQDSALLSDTLEANVLLGAGTSRADLVAALRPIGADALVEATAGRRLGPGGVAVSGGERQWIALGRALATSQPVLLLDEPTSGLDPASQAEVLDAIARLRGSRSILLVTHRPEPLALADLIIRIEADAARVEDGPMRRQGPTPRERATEA
jgi:ABC-type transport system involved in cytochrome bd biosynthesis fused ATPase/permease subunit